MAYRTSVPDLTRSERDRLDRDRFYERDREDDRDRYSEIRDRFEGGNDHVYSRAPPRVPSRPPAREPSERRYRRYEDEEDDFSVRERRRVTYDDGPRYERRRPSPPDSEIDRRVFIQRERERVHSPSPPRRRPGLMVRRQSSLDTFDRRPIRHYDRDYSPPSLRGDYRIPPNVPIPLPRSKALPPPRVYAEKDYFADIRVAEPRRYDGDEYRAPERVREKEIIRERRRRSRSRSRSSRGTSRRSRSSSSSSSSSSDGTARTGKSEYPKKGKTRIPARLVSKRALIELGYPYTEEGNVIIVQKALGQQNIDDLLKLSDEFKKSELEILAARSSAGDIMEERRTEIIDVAPAPSRQYNTGAVVVAAPPPVTHTVEFAKTATVRDVSPARSYTTTSYDSTTSYDTTITSTSSGTTTTVTPVIVDARHPPIGGGEMVLVERPHRHHHSRSRSRHSRHGSRDIVRAERLSTGELVLYEEQVERVEEPSRGVRIEKDRKGRMSISVPKYR